jgi:hypothetical protein
MDEPTADWENEGGSPATVPRDSITGTVNQIAWAEQIRESVGREFDRVRRALASAADRQSSTKRIGTLSIIDILEEKRMEVMGHTRAGYFIQDWQDLRVKVRRMILADARYQAIRDRPQRLP